MADFGLAPRPNDKEEFTLSSEIKKTFKTIGDAYQIPDWVQSSIGEAGSEFYQMSRQLIPERAAIIDKGRRQEIEFIR